MPNIFAAYQSRLRIFFFQGTIYFLLFTIFLTLIRLLMVGDWQSLVKIIIYAVVILIIIRCLYIIRKENTTFRLAIHQSKSSRSIDPFTEYLAEHSAVASNREMLQSSAPVSSAPVSSARVQGAQKLGVIILMLTTALYIAITPHDLFVLGVIMLATILFFSVLSTEPQLAREWLGLSIILFLVALTLRQIVPVLRIDYSLDLLFTLYVFPPFFFWLCARSATNLLNHLAELLAAGQELEADLHQSEVLYQQLLQTMNEGFVIVDEQEIFVYVNDKFCEMVGYRRDELIGQCNETFLIYDEQDLQTLRRQTQMRSHNQRSTYELRTQRKDGTPIHLRISAVPRIDSENTICGTFSVVMDITERKAIEEMLRSERALLCERVEERTASLRTATEALQKELHERKQIELALRNAEEEYRTLFDNVPIGIYRSSLDGRQLRANPVLVALNGYASEQEMLHSVKDIGAEWYVDGHRRTEFQAEIEQHGLVRNFESEVYRYKSRERIWISETAILVRNSAREPLYYQGTVQDITERKANEDARERFIVQLAKAARLKDEFLASMSHELRTPLNSILGMTEALQDEIYGSISDRQQKALRTVETSGRHLLALINDILDLAKIESGQVELISDAVDVAAVCESTLRLVQPTATKKSITIEHHYDTAIRVMMADGRRIKQMLINLLSNAIKFTSAGERIGLEIWGNTTPIPEITFVVWDTGVGIPDEAREHLFEPFVQVDSSLSRRFEGTGLGLALVKRMVELHGGTITVESQVDQGSRFIVKLPWSLPGEEQPKKTTDLP